MALLKIINKSICLQTLCESNYHKLLQLVPNLTELSGSTTLHSAGKPALYLKILERTPYTLAVEISHCFLQNADIQFEPAVKLHVYLDLRSTEVLQDHVRPHAAQGVRDFPNPKAVMDYKWTQNYFLKRWLDHCLHMGYQFPTTAISNKKKSEAVLQ